MIDRIPVALTAALVLLAAAPSGAGDWPQFRGPHRNGVGDESGLARAWGETGPKELWRLPLGAGYAGVIAAGDRVWTLAGDDAGEWAVCLGAADGKELWRTPIGEAWADDVGLVGPRSTPTLAGDTLFVVGSRATVHALDAASGAVKWSVDLLERFGGQVPRFGYSPSPLVDGELVIVDGGGGEGKAYAALDRATGATKWTVGDGRFGYGSPLAIDVAGERRYLFVGRKILGIAPDGTVAFSGDSLPGIIAAPIFLPPDRFFASASDDVGAMVVRLIPGSAPTFEEVWKSKVMKNHFSSSLLIGSHIYGFDNATFKCIDAATGELAWARRGYGKGSLIAADGLLFVLTDQGRLVVGEASPEGFTESGSAQVLTGAKSWTAPSIANGRLYVRHSKELVALSVGAAG